MTASPPLPASRRAAFVFIFVTILLDMLAFGMVMPVLPRLIESFLNNDTAQAARIYGIFGTAWALMQFLWSPFLGMLSDRFGRRPVVLLSNFGLALDYVLMALAPGLVLLFVGRIVAGICSATISTSFAYLTDITEPEKRAATFGKVGAAFGAGFILGPALGGLLGGIDLRLPFWVAAGMSFANGLYGLLVLPESLPPEKRAPFRWARANPLGSLKLLRSHRTLARLAFVNFFAQLAHVVLVSVSVLYAGYRYAWNEQQVGLMLAFVGLCAMVVQGGLTGPVVTWLGARNAMLAGLAFGVAAFAVFGYAPTGVWFLAAIVLVSLWGIAGPAMMGIMTHHVSASEQGQLQGANSSVQSIAQLVGPGLFTYTFAHFIGVDAPLTLPGAPFYLAAIFLAMALLLAWRALAQQGDEPQA
jgi:DHA1 family tetracycline resistance protein-like MFS transporter